MADIGNIPLQNNKKKARLRSSGRSSIAPSSSSPEAQEVESAEEPERNITDNALIYNRKNKK